METDLQRLSSSSRWHEIDPPRGPRRLRYQLIRLLSGLTQQSSGRLSGGRHTASSRLVEMLVELPSEAATAHPETLPSPFVSPLTGRADNR